MKTGNKKTTFSSGPSYKPPSKGKRPPTAGKRAEPIVNRQKASVGWDNSNTTDSKFFDKSQDKDFMRKQQRGSARASSAKAKTVQFAQNSDLPQVERDGTHLDVKFYTKGGR